MPNFVDESPEMQSLLQSIMRNSDRAVKDKTIRFIPGGAGAGKALYSGTNILSSPILDILGGVGQYKLPHRLLGAAAGGLLLGDEHQPVSAIGLAGGYGASLGLDEGIKYLRRRSMADIVRAAEDAGTIRSLTPESLLERVSEISAATRNKDLSRALRGYLSLNAELGALPGTTILDSYSNKNGVSPVRIVYSGDIAALDDAGFADLTKKLNKIVSQSQDFPGFSKKIFREMMQNNINAVKDSAEGFNSLGWSRGLDTNLPDFIKAHELLEADLVNERPAYARRPMIGGDLSMQGASMFGTNKIQAAHESPAVILREGNLRARAGSMASEDFLGNLRKATQEEKILEKLLGAKPGSVIIPEEYIKANSNTIAEVLDAIKTKKMPTQEVLDSLKLNKVVSTLGQVGEGISNAESGLSRILKSLLRRKL